MLKGQVNGIQEDRIGGAFDLNYNGLIAAEAEVRQVRLKGYLIFEGVSFAGQPVAHIFF